MKVAFFLGALNKGGMESLIYDVCRRCQTAPFEVICLYRKEGNFSEDFHQTPAQLVKIERKRSLLRYMWDIRSFVKKEHIDIVHAQTPPNVLICIFALVFLRTKIVTTFHGICKNKYEMKALRCITAFCDMVCCVSDYEQRYYVEKMGLHSVKKLCVVYNGVDFNKIDTPKQNQASAFENSQINLCMVGNFVPGRSPWIIAEALKLLNNRGITCFNFSFIGRRVDNEEWRYDRCVKICKGMNNVHFLGARNDVSTLLNHMDGFVYSTQDDTFGIAVVEAMAAGLPTIVNDWAVMKEITKDGQWATLFKTEDVEDCAEKIEELLNDLEARKIQARKIAAEVRAEYSIERHIERLAEIYNEVINN